MFLPLDLEKAILLEFRESAVMTGAIKDQNARIVLEILYTHSNAINPALVIEMIEHHRIEDLLDDMRRIIRVRELFARFLTHASQNKLFKK